MTRPTKPITERLWARVTKTQGGCWLWGGPTSNGYGVIGSGGRGGRTIRVHRLSWEIANGQPVPVDMQIDHLCRVRNCVNPDHLEVVTQAENLRRAGLARTSCPSGHELPPRGDRKRRPGCPTCAHIAYEKKKVA